MEHSVSFHDDDDDDASVMLNARERRPAGKHLAERYRALSKTSATRHDIVCVVSLCVDVGLCDHVSASGLLRPFLSCGFFSLNLYSFIHIWLNSVLKQRVNL